VKGKHAGYREMAVELVERLVRNHGWSSLFSPLRTAPSI
jgi:hypothetical protein